MCVLKFSHQCYGLRGVAFEDKLGHKEKTFMNASSVLNLKNKNLQRPALWPSTEEALLRH